LALSVCGFFVCVRNISGTAERICVKFTPKTCLVTRSDEFESQGQWSKVKVTRDKNGISGPFGGICDREPAISLKRISLEPNLLQRVYRNSYMAYRLVTNLVTSVTRNLRGQGHCVTHISVRTNRLTQEQIAVGSSNLARVDHVTRHV